MNERRNSRFVIVVLLLGIAGVLYLAKLRRDALLDWHVQPETPRTASSQSILLQVPIREDEIAQIDDNSLLLQATFVPHFDKGLQDGLIVFQIRENSLLSKFHISEGDVIISVDHVPLQNREQVPSFLKLLKGNGNVALELNRAGQKRTIMIIISK